MRSVIISFHKSTFFFFFNDTATTEIYTLSLHDALPIWKSSPFPCGLTFQEKRRKRCIRSEEHTSELQSQSNLVCRLLLEKKKKLIYKTIGLFHLRTNTIPHLCI